MNALCAPEENKPLNDGRGGFMNTKQSRGRGNEIIGSAHFSMGRAIFRIIRGSIVFLLCIMAGFVTLSMEEPLWSILVFVVGLLMLRSLLDLVLSDRIIFYGDKVTKIWHIFGPRTIYFSRAKIWRVQSRVDPLMWVIRETGPNGERLFMKKPIIYDPPFFPSEASEEILSLLIDLAGDEIEGGRYTMKDHLIAGLIPFAILLCTLLLIYFCSK
jgi:hypothetical protein